MTAKYVCMTAKTHAQQIDPWFSVRSSPKGSLVDLSPEGLVLDVVGAGCFLDIQ